jgi:hypothetical protein
MALTELPDKVFQPLHLAETMVQMLTVIGTQYVDRVLQKEQQVLTEPKRVQDHPEVMGQIVLQ